MGRDQVTLTAYASVSRHNSEQDKIDNQTWNSFVWAVNKAAAEADFDGLFIDVSAVTFDAPA